jgi:hypothetical protein
VLFWNGRQRVKIWQSASEYTAITGNTPSFVQTKRFQDSRDGCSPLDIFNMELNASLVTCGACRSVVVAGGGDELLNDAHFS